MPYTENHNPDVAGKGRRYVVGSAACLAVRLDPESYGVLKWAAKELSYLKGPKERLSQSTVVRRALKVYKTYLLHILNDPALVSSEKEEARQGTKLPDPPRPRDIDRRDKRRAVIAYNRANPSKPTFPTIDLGKGKR